MTVKRVSWSEQENLKLMHYAAQSKKGPHSVKWDKESIASLFGNRSIRQCQRQYIKIRNKFEIAAYNGSLIRLKDVSDIAQKSIGKKRKALRLLPKALPFDISTFIPGMNDPKSHSKQSFWSNEEDKIIVHYAIRKLADGVIDWSDISQEFENRSSIDCSFRYYNTLMPMALRNSSVLQLGLQDALALYLQSLDALSQSSLASDFSDPLTQSLINSFEYLEQAMPYSEALEHEVFSVSSFDLHEVANSDTVLNAKAFIEMSEQERDHIESLLPADTFLKAIALQDERSIAAFFETPDDCSDFPRPYSRALTEEEMPQVDLLKEIISKKSDNLAISDGNIFEQLDSLAYFYFPTKDSTLDVVSFEQSDNNLSFLPLQQEGSNSLNGYENDLFCSELP